MAQRLAVVKVPFDLMRPDEIVELDDNPVLLSRLEAGYLEELSPPEEASEEPVVKADGKGRNQQS